MEPDRSIGMLEICRILESKNISLKRFKALDLFARKGDWQTYVYANQVATLEAWEILPEFEAELNQNLPNAIIRITDSILELKNGFSNKYDFIVLDNPQNTFGENHEYCEHFDVLPHIHQLIDKKAIVIFNINKNPFNIEKYEKWENRRNQFYGKEETKNININELAHFYTQYFLDFRLKTNFNFAVFREECKPLDYLYYFVFELEKINYYD